MALDVKAYLGKKCVSICKVNHGTLTCIVMWPLEYLVSMLDDNVILLRDPIITHGGCGHPPLINIQLILLICCDVIISN